VTIEASSEHLKLKEQLDRHGVSMQDIDKLLKLLSNAKRYGFDGKEIADKLYNIQELDWKEKQLKDKCNRWLDNKLYYPVLHTRMTRSSERTYSKLISWAILVGL
jgi:hypothetical protein